MFRKQNKQGLEMDWFWVVGERKVSLLIYGIDGRARHWDKNLIEVRTMGTYGPGGRRWWWEDGKLGWVGSILGRLSLSWVLESKGRCIVCCQLCTFYTAIVAWSFIRALLLWGHIPWFSQSWGSDRSKPLVLSSKSTSGSEVIYMGNKIKLFFILLLFL